MIEMTFAGKIQGAGSPNYLGGAYCVQVVDIGGDTVALVTAFDDNALGAFDVDDPTSITLRDSIQGTGGGPNYLSGASKVKMHTISATEYAFVTAYKDGALSAFNVSNPDSISQVGEITGDGTPNFLKGAYGLDIAEISSVVYAFVTSILDDALVVININNPASMSLSDTLTGAGSPNYLDGAHGVVVAQVSSVWYAFVVSFYDNALSVVNVNNPASISLVTAVEGEGSPDFLGGAHSVDLLTIGGTEYLFISSYYEDSLVIYDVSTPATPTYIAKITGGQSPNYLEEITGVQAIALSGIPFVFATGYLDDSVTAVRMSIPTAPLLGNSVQGQGSPNYLLGAHDLFVNADNIFVASYNDDALVAFDTEVRVIDLSATVSVQTSTTGVSGVGGPVSVSAVIEVITYAIAGESEVDIDWGDFLDEIKKPHWYPILRCYMYDWENKKVDVSDKVSDYDRVLWQIEQEYHQNEFTANDCNIRFRNEDDEFDTDDHENFFVTQLGRDPSGYRTPVIIEVGYRRGEELLMMPLFYGLVVDIGTTTNDDEVVMTLQCISRILRDAECDDFGDLWTEQQLYGGNSMTHTGRGISPTIAPQDEEILAEDNAGTDDNFPEGFPPSGFIQIEEEIIFYGTITPLGFGNCLRGRFGTIPAEHTSNTLIRLTLNDGSDTEGRLFQLPVYPISEGSVTSIYSSDGDIVLYDKDVLIGLSYAERQLAGYLDYDTGVLELGAEPTDSATLFASYKTCPRNVTYHGLVKRLLQYRDLTTSQVEDCDLSEVFGEPVPITYGKITHAWIGGNLEALSGGEAFAMATDSVGNIYIGIGGTIVRWDGERYTIVADMGTENYIFYMELDEDDNIYGVCGAHFFYEPAFEVYKHIFKWDGDSLTFLITDEACYLHQAYGSDFYSGTLVQSPQWKGGFSVDDDNDLVWYLYRTGGMGLAKIPLAGGSPVRYSRGVAGPGAESAMDFCDSGDYIEFFYHDSGWVIQYDRFRKSNNTWYPIGTVYQASDGSSTKPWGAVYHPDEGRVYFNVTETDVGGSGGGLYSVPVGTANETLVEEYLQGETDSRWDRYCGGVYYDGYIWYVRGTDIAMGMEIHPTTGEEIGDKATGHLYRVANNVIEDMTALALRPVSRSRYANLREPVKGHASKLVVRPTDDAIFFLASDGTVRWDHTYGYSFGQYSEEFIPRVRVANLNDRTVWNVLSELAVLAAYEMGITRDGKVFWRPRNARVSQLAGDITPSDTTISCDGVNFDSFEDSGMMQIGKEVIAYSGKSSNNFTGCVRGYYGSTAAEHKAPATIWPIAAVLTNVMPNESTLKFASKQPNYDEIFNYIEVPYGELTAIFNWEKAGEVWLDSSEYLFGKHVFTVGNEFLTDYDGTFAEAIAWRYYDIWRWRHGRIEAETKWQPQLDLGDVVSIKQNERTPLDYAISRIRRLEVMSSDVYVRLVALYRPARYRKTIYDYDYEYHEF